MKFGGSSVADARNWPRIGAEAANVLASGGNALIVVSALGGITDLLESCLRAPDQFDPDTTLAEIRRRHAVLAGAVEADAGILEPLFDALREALVRVQSTNNASEAATCQSPELWAELMGFGELLSSRLGEHILRSQGLECDWLDSRELLVCSDNPQRSERAARLSAECEVAPSPDVQARLAARGRLFIAPGFIARNAAGETVLLGRGGSDISAALIGTLLDADRVEIFSDVPGLFSADPRRIPSARLLRTISY
ncbi:MAG: hypothetical protein WDZ60_01260, partial [Wenzhouxiangellaceae bacterium]